MYLVNPTVGAEVARFFLTIAVFKVTTSNIGDFDAAFYIDKYASLLHKLSLSLGDHIYYLNFLDFNATKSSEVHESDLSGPHPDFYTHDRALKRAKKSNAANSQLLLWSYFMKVQRLEMVFYTPTVEGKLQQV
jgi:hypothetical protein